MVGRLYHLCQTSRVYRCKWFLGNDCPKPQAENGKSSCCGDGRGSALARRPTLRERAVTFASTMAKFAADGFQFATEAEQTGRQQLCGTCPLNEQGWCRSCGCHLSEKFKLRVSYCPAGKWFIEQPARPLGGPRHLLYFVCPVRGNGVWQWNVRQLLERIDLFDGVRSIAVAAPPSRKFELEPPDVVRQAFEGHRIDHWIVRSNDDKLREAAFWLGLLTTVQEQRGATFFGHSKGVTRNWDQACTWWVAASYQTCLDDWASVERALAQYSMAGPFKRYGMFALPGSHRWHYSGTFFWFRNDDVFGGQRDWRKLVRSFVGVEAWPGFLFGPTETACLLGEDCGNVYDLREWERKLLTDWQTWKSARGVA